MRKNFLPLAGLPRAGAQTTKRKAALKIETTFTDDHQATLKVAFDPEPMEGYKRRAARQIAKSTKIPGFRPGKAPYHMVERTVGLPTILEEAINLLVDEQYPKILDEAGVKPYGPGSLTSIEEFDPPVLVFSVPLEPEVKLADYKAVRVDYDLKPVEDQQVEDTLDDLLERSMQFDEVERPAQEGDQVTILLSAERKQAVEGKVSTLIREREVPVIVETAEEEGKRSWPFPGFSRHLVGLAVGDEKTIDYTYPEDSVMESLRGTEAEFKVKVQAVKVSNKPALDDAFAKTMGEFETVEDLRSEVRSSLEERQKNEEDERFREQIMEKLLADAEVKFPPQMLEQEIEGMVEQLKRRMQEQGVDYPTYLKTRQMDEAAFREEVKPNAETRLKRSLILLEILKQEDLHVHPDELQAETIRMLGQLGEMMPAEEFRKATREDNLQNLIGNVSSELLIQKAWKRLEAIARGQGEQAAAEEALAHAHLHEAEESEAAVEEAPVEAAPEAAAEETPAEPAE
jgi:trigger factor